MRITLHYAALAGVIAGATLLADRRHGVRFAALVCIASVAVACAVVLAFPVWAAYYPSDPSTEVFVVGSTLLLAVADAVALALPAATVHRLLGASLVVRRLALVVLGAVVPLGLLEATAQLTTRSGVVPYFVPVETVVAQRSEDWRTVSIMSDNYREPDPLLFWRPIPRYPYSAQRFKGPEIAESKPTGTFRLFCYGDSNTDGPPVGKAWPAQLQSVLDERTRGSARRYEVVNAGVTGYSSYQGLQRFTEEVDRFTPDLILVSFGWNDAAPAIGEPDKSFAETSRRLAANPSLLFLRRVLLGYRSLLVARRVFDGRAQPAVATKSDSPRVSLADYEANLRAFIDSAQTKGIVPVLLTRPHRAPAQALRREPTWRHDVPDYNAVALRVAHERHVPVVDVQRAFDERPGLFVDECHFTEEGHHEMATLIDQALANAGLLR